jgi:hypothetical protein
MDEIAKEMYAALLNGIFLHDIEFGPLCRCAGCNGATEACRKYEKATNRNPRYCVDFYRKRIEQESANYIPKRISREQVEKIRSAPEFISDEA